MQNPITQFRGWLARRWCEKWASDNHGSVRQHPQLSGAYLANAYEDMGGCVASCTGPTRAHAWIALRRELEGKL